MGGWGDWGRKPPERLRAISDELFELSPMLDRISVKQPAALIADFARYSDAINELATELSGGAWPRAADESEYQWDIVEQGVRALRESIANVERSDGSATEAIALAGRAVRIGRALAGGSLAEAMAALDEEGHGHTLATS